MIAISSTISDTSTHLQSQKCPNPICSGTPRKLHYLHADLQWRNFKGNEQSVQGLGAKRRGSGFRGAQQNLGLYFPERIPHCVSFLILCATAEGAHCSLEKPHQDGLLPMGTLISTMPTVCGGPETHRRGLSSCGACASRSAKVISASQRKPTVRDFRL